ENFVICAGRFDFVDVAGVGELLAVRRNHIDIIPAEMEQRHIVIARRETAWCCRGACAKRLSIRLGGCHIRRYTDVSRHYKQMAALERSERAPMSIEQARKNFRFHFALL